jgi:uncharacterized protein (TIGR02246 family)
VTLLVVVGALGGCTQAADTTEVAADEARLEADALAWFDRYAKGDAEGMANLYAEDALLMPPGAPSVTGRPAIKAFLGEDAAKSRAAGISIKNVSVTGSSVTGDSAWISGRYVVLDGSGATIDSGSYLSVHSRTNGAWLYVRDIWNSDRPAAQAPETTTTQVPGLGTWKLNVAKSKYDPGPPPRSSTVTFTAMGENIKAVIDGVGPDGAGIHWEYVAALDGSQHPVTGNPDGDMVVVTRTEAGAIETSYTLEGKPTVVNARVLSADGNTMTVTSKGTDAKWQKINHVLVFEKG